MISPNDKWITSFLVVLAVIFCFTSAVVLAAVTDYEKNSPNQIIVSPRRFPQDISQVSENVEVLNEEDLSSSIASDPSEAITSVAGVDVTSKTQFGHFAPLSIQGSESRHVLVMVDDIPFNNQASGQADVLSALPLTYLDRIEIIKGSASNAWGSSLGGVIDLITKDVGASVIPHGHWTSALAEFGTSEHSFDVQGAVGSLGYYLAGEYRNSGGTRTTAGTIEHEDTLQKKMFGKLAYPFSDILKATASFGYSGAEENDGVYPSDPVRTHMPYFARYGQFRLEADRDDLSHLEAAFKFNRQLILSDTLDGVTDDLITNVRTSNHYYGVELKDIIKLRDNDILAFGYDLSNSILKSSQMHESRSVLIQAPYVNYTMLLEPFEFLAGLRVDANEEFGNQLSPNAGAVFHFPNQSHTSLRVNVTRAFNAPPLLWKYFEDISPGLTANNPDIQPERAWVYEAGIQNETIANLFLKFSVYRSDITEAIHTVLNNQGLYIKKNFDKFRQQGFEFETKVKLSKLFSGFFSADFNDVEDRATRQTVSNRGVTRPSFKGGFQVEAPSGFTIRLNGRYDRWDSAASIAPNDRKFIFDGRISQKIKNITKEIDLTFFINVYNLTNSKYWSDRDYPLPQRYFEAGATLDF